jgi:hypothetical protein
LPQHVCRLRSLSQAISSMRMAMFRCSVSLRRLAIASLKDGLGRLHIVRHHLV